MNYAERPGILDSWAYIEVSAEVFALRLTVTGCPAKALADNPRVKELHAGLAKIRTGQKVTFADGEHGDNVGPLDAPEAWRGLFVYGTACKFRVSRVEAYDGGISLWFAGPHTQKEIESMLDGFEANAPWSEPSAAEGTTMTPAESDLVQSVSRRLHRITGYIKDYEGQIEPLERLKATIANTEIDNPITLDEARERMGKADNRTIWEPAADMLMLREAAKLPPPKSIAELIEESATVVQQTQIKSVWGTGLAAKVQLVFSNTAPVRTVPRQVWQRIVAEAKVSVADFALEFKVECFSDHGLASVGALFNPKTGKNCIALIATDPLQFIFMEPQDGGIMENTERPYEGGFCII